MSVPVDLGRPFALGSASQVNVSLANASTTAEKAVGANAHATAVRIGVVHGFLVYMALVMDSWTIKSLSVLSMDRLPKF